MVFSGITSAMTATGPSLATLHVGASGFSYPSWRPDFYPAGAKPEEFLRLYSERLTTVELNATFYRMTAPEQYARWAAETPPGFRFAVTMSRVVTARGTVQQADEFLAGVAALGDRLGPVRVKVPMKRDDAFLDAFLDAFESLRLVLDFRHDSWDDSEVLARLDSAGAVRAGALEGAADFRYLRFREPPFTDADLAALATRDSPAALPGSRGLRLLPPRGRADRARLRRAAPRTRRRRVAFAEKEEDMAFEVPALPYAYDALEPTIDEATMKLHHDKHHQAYVDKANAALEGTEWADKPVEQVIANLEILPADKQGPVRNNAGGHANHSLFWEIMSPDGGGDPSGALGDAIASTFDSLDALKQQVNDAGVNRFGSGWTWLVHDGTGLAVMSTANQDSPIMEGKTPLLGIDVWEHAYYLNYQNRRPDYLATWWNVVNWDEVGRRYDEAAAS